MIFLGEFFIYHDKNTRFSVCITDSFDKTDFITEIFDKTTTGLFLPVALVFDHQGVRRFLY